MAAIEQTGNIGVELELKLIGGDIFQGVRSGQTGIIDQAVQLSKVFYKGLEALFNRIRIANIRWIGPDFIAKLGRSGL